MCNSDADNPLPKCLGTLLEIFLDYTQLLV